MDKLLLGRFDQIDLEQETSKEPQKFSSLYKNKLKLSQKQNQRRQEILLNSKSKRDKLISSIRRLVSDIACDDDEAKFPTSHTSTDAFDNQDQEQDQGILRDHDMVSCGEDDGNDATDHDNYDDGENGQTGQRVCQKFTHHNNQTSPNNQHSRDKQYEYRKFRNKAMLSEWLIQRPMNFETEWLLRATPVGKRCLVFSRKGDTVAYSRTGKFIQSFQSILPGGCKVQSTQCRRQFAILDCIYVQSNNSFYLMDCLAWNEHKLYESEASFRFFWLQSRYNELQDKLQMLSSRNESRFYCLKTYSASNEQIYEALHNDQITKEHNLELDGLLFFHSRGPYVPGANPLVLWIKPDMVDRVLNLDST